MISLRIKLQELLKKFHPRIYFQEAPKSAEFPYVVYDLPDSFDRQPGDNIRLEIDAWDDNEDTTELEELVETINGDGDIFKPTGLNMATLIEEGEFVATLYKDNQLSQIDPDERIKRRHLKYEIHIYYEK